MTNRREAVTAVADVSEAMAAVGVVVAQANRTRLAKELDLDRPYVSLVLARKKEPGLRVAAKMARALNLSLDDFYGYLTGELVN